jgi:hypothetical protein
MKEPMSIVGQIEKKTQQRVVKLFREQRDVTANRAEGNRRGKSDS